VKNVRLTVAFVAILMTIGLVSGGLQPTTASADSLPTFDATDNSYFQMVNQALTWDQAERMAASMTYLGLQGFLATPVTATAENIVATLVANGNGAAWLGGHSSNGIGGLSINGVNTVAREWYWAAGPLANDIFQECSNIGGSAGAGCSQVTGEKFLAWAGGAPDNFGYSAGTSNSGQDSLYQYAGGWDDINGSTTMGFVVEFHLPEAVDCGNLTPMANLAGCNFSGANLQNLDLDGANLSSANLTGATLFGSTLAWANLTGANLSNAGLDGANMSGANLTNATLNYASGNYLMLNDANLTGANLTGTWLSRANLGAANLYATTVTGTYFWSGGSCVSGPTWFHCVDPPAVLSNVLSGAIVGTPAVLAPSWTLSNGYLSSPNSPAISGLLVPPAPVVAIPTPAAPQSLTWSWSNSDSSVTSYSWSGTCSGSGNVTSVTCTGLTGGQSYTLSVTATNANGTSSVASNSGVAQDIPTAPVVATPVMVGRGQARWTWSSSADNGAPITSYSWSGACSGSGDVTSATCSSLPGGTTQSLAVTATNAMGTSSPVASSLTMPVTSPDDVVVAITSAPNSFVAKWTTPQNGGAALTGYNVGVFAGSNTGRLLKHVVLKPTATSYSVAGLTNGAYYTFVITAQNTAFLTSNPTIASNIEPLVAAKLSAGVNTYSFGATKTTLSAKVAASATGTISFASTGSQLCVSTVTKGVANCVISSTLFDAGTYPLTVSYSGDSATAATSVQSSLVVKPAHSTLHVVVNLIRVSLAHLGSEQATAVLGSDIGVTPPGTVTFSLDGTIIASGTLKVLFSTLENQNLSLGVHTISANYSGSTDFTPSTAKIFFTVA